MAGLLDLFGSDASQPGALYGGLLTPDQNKALAYRGLLAAAGAFGQAAMPSRMPIPIGAALGSAAAAMGTAQDTSGENALKGMLVGLQGKNLESQLNIRNQLLPIAQQILNGSGGAGTAPASSGGMLGSAPNAAIGGVGGADNWETQHNNFAGMRIPGVNKGPNAGGFQSFETPEAGITAISDQLDRYANGSTTGKPLTTLSQIISTWAPPSENDTPALIARASKIMGVAPDAPLDLSNADTKAKLVEAMIRNEQGGNLPTAAAAAIPKALGAKNFSPYGIDNTYGFPVVAGSMPKLPTQVAQANTGTVSDALPPSSAAAGGPGTAGLLPSVNPAGNAGAPGIPTAPTAPQGLLDRLNAASSSAAPLTSLLPPQIAAAPPTDGSPAPAPQGMLPPQPPQIAQAAPPVPAPSGAPGMGMPQPPNINPRALAAGGLLAGLGGMPDVFKPLENYYYQSPGYIAQKAGAEHAGALPYIGPEAAAKAAATFPYEFQLGRSKFLTSRSGAVFDPVLGKEIYQPPSLEKTIGPNGEQQYTYMTPGLNGGTPTLQPTGAVAGMAPAAHAQATESGKLSAEFGGLPGAQPGASLSQPAAMPSKEPIATPQGTKLPPLTEQFMPQSAAELEHAVPAWQKKTDEWNAGIAPARQAEMRLGTIAEAFKLTETGAFETHKAELATALKALGIDPSLVMQTNPAAVQQALHDNILTTLPLLKAATPRPSQIEFMSVSENREHPNLQPAANLRMLTEDLALVRQAQQLPADWNAAQQQGWRNPQSFETAWSRLNPLDTTRDQVEKEIGPLKGMPGNTTPKQSASEGAIVVGPNGQRLQNRGGQWLDLQTLKPYSPGQ